MKSKYLVPLVFASCAACASGATTSAKPSDLVGSWQCASGAMQGPGFTITAQERITREASGKYVSLGTTVIAAPNRTPITMQDRSTGTWELEGQVIKTHVLTATFLSASDPSITMQAGQQAQDDQLAKKSVYLSRIVELTGQRYRTFPVNSMYKQAEVEVSCERT